MINKPTSFKASERLVDPAHARRFAAGVNQANRIAAACINESFHRIDAPIHNRGAQAILSSFDAAASTYLFL